MTTKPICHKLKTCAAASTLTFGDFYAISYFLKLHGIQTTPALRRLMQTPLTRGFNRGEYTDSENKAIAKLLFGILLYSDNAHVEDKIRTEKKAERYLARKCRKKPTDPIQNQLKKSFIECSRLLVLNFIKENTNLNLLRYEMYLQIVNK
jgi:hypothetical protein